jgi:hypothetical protein
VDWDTVLIGFITASATLTAVWLTGRTQARARWADEQRQVIGTMLQEGEQAAHWMSAMSDASFVDPAVRAFFDAWGQAQLLIPKALLKPAGHLHLAINSMHSAWLLGRAMEGYEKVDEENERVAKLEDLKILAERRSSELLRAARSHFGLAS